MRTFWKKEIYTDGPYRAYELLWAHQGFEDTLIQHDYERITCREAVRICVNIRRMRLNGIDIVGDAYIYPLEFDFNTPLTKYALDSRNPYIVKGVLPGRRVRRMRITSALYGHTRQ